MKIVTSYTIWNDAVGKRMSITYSELDQETGRIISDSNRIDRVITDSTIISEANDILNYATNYVNNI